MSTVNELEEARKIARINRDTFELLTINPDFIKEIEAIRKKLGISSGGFNSDQESRDWHHKDIETNEAQNLIQMSIDLKEILKNFKLPKSFEDSMSLYLLYNKIDRVPGQNYGVGFKDGYINITIYKRPTKNEWASMKYHVNELLDAAKEGKFPNYFEGANYPDGSKTAKIKPTLKRNIEILKKSESLGQENTIIRDDEEKYKYGDADIEADVFPEGNIKQSKKNKNNIRVIRNRYKRYTKRST